MRRVLVQDISYNLKDKVKRQLKTKLKGSNKFFEKVLSKTLKPKSESLRILVLSMVPYF